MNLRQNNLSKLQQGVYDVLIVGGGINGAVAAASLAARGVSVALIEAEDFASQTSSSSSNLAWGGIKYLETYEFGLVNKLCKSRNHLMQHYPSTVREIRFFTTIQKGFRYPPMLVFLGTILYWFLGRFRTQPPAYLSPSRIKQKEPVVDTDKVVGGFEYSDCYLYDNDARFVFNFIRTSMNYGCIAANYVKSTGSHRADGLWTTKAQDTLSGDTFNIQSKVLINACGPLADRHNNETGQQTQHHHLFSKGIHLIVDRITEHERVLAFFASDGRLFFVIPMGPKTCVGTTDTQVEDPKVEVTDQDRQFVLDNINSLLELPQPLTQADIIAERCGVRPLAVEGSSTDADWVKLSRKHAIDVNTQEQHLTIFGGKLTDCLNVGDEVAQLVEQLGIAQPYKDTIWYGEPPAAVQEEFIHQANLMKLDELTPESSSELLSTRLWRRYGADAIDMLESIRQDPARAELLIENAEYLRCEIEHAAAKEMITKLDDFLRRRSKISQVVRTRDIIDAPGLHEACRILFGEQAETKLQEYINDLNQTKT
ncbi:MAG: glycerol-3-phosphate dehydrogenase/oxidase [Pseudomonadales bacterium]